MPREDVTSAITAQIARADVLRQARLIVWDEAPMAPREALECVDMLLRGLLANNLPSWGKVLVLGGDFRHVLFVMPHCAREDIVGQSIKAHNLWISGLVSVFSLATNMRAR